MWTHAPVTSSSHEKKAAKPATLKSAKTQHRPSELLIGGIIDVLLLLLAGLLLDLEVEVRLRSLDVDASWPMLSRSPALSCRGALSSWPGMWERTRPAAREMSEGCGDAASSGNR